MHARRRAQYCRHCRCHTLFRWIEPKHHAYAALTVAMIGTTYLTPATGVILLALWAQRITSTRRWACPHCNQEDNCSAFAA
jgi:hypothetical protein